MAGALDELKLSTYNKLSLFFLYPARHGWSAAVFDIRRSRLMTSQTMASRLRTHVASAAIVLMAFAGPAVGQNYPNRQIMLMLSTTAGASPDLIARLFARQLSEGLKTPVVVENKGGANGQIAVQAIADAAPDGYTFLATTGATLAINPTLHPQTAQLVMMQLAPVTQLARQDFVITARPAMNVRTLPELIAWSRKNPGKLNVATTAQGSIAYLTAQLFEQAAGIEFVTVAHNGGEQAVIAMLNNSVDVLVETITLSRQYIEAGKLVPIAVTGPTRSAFLPNVPTLTELNLDVQTSGWTAIVAPKNTPTEIMARVQQELSKGLQSSDLRMKLGDLCAEPIINSPDAFAREWKREAEMWEKVIKKVGIKLE
jgi:tripartite-type tricarboxylate transporter receptor subunit TctC